MIGLDSGDEIFEIFAELGVLFAEGGEVFRFVFGFGYASLIFDAGDYACLCHDCFFVGADGGISEDTICM